MARRARKLNIQVDPRTDDMSRQALFCRSMNHPWEDPAPMSPARRLELLRIGQTETVWYCLRCAAVRTDVYELPSFVILSSRIDYPDDYLIKEKGTGRLSRAEARKALYMRDALV